jgi:hypothetical protein
MYEVIVWSEPIAVTERPGSRPGKLLIEAEDYEPFEIDEGTHEEKVEQIARVLHARSDGTFLGPKD